MRTEQATTTTTNFTSHEQRRLATAASNASHREYAGGSARHHHSSLHAQLARYRGTSEYYGSKHCHTRGRAGSGAQTATKTRAYRCSASRRHHGERDKPGVVARSSAGDQTASPVPTGSPSSESTQQCNRHSKAVSNARLACSPAHGASACTTGQPQPQHKMALERGAQPSHNVTRCLLLPLQHRSRHTHWHMPTSHNTNEA